MNAPKPVHDPARITTRSGEDEEWLAFFSQTNCTRLLRD
jgi:hypothetical protein